MIDSHAHLYFDRFDQDRDEVIARALKNGVDRVINIGIDVQTSHQSVELAQDHDGFYAAVGLHPTSPIDDVDKAVDEVRQLAKSHRKSVVAIGEIGLDYYWKDVAPEDQKAKLRAQLALARELDLPVIFHCREALDDLFAILDQCLGEERALPPGVFHCFSGGPSEAERALNLGFHVSFAGNVTYPKAIDLQAAARAVPAEKLLLETDAPFLAPQARRGKRNEPSFLPLTCDFLASLKAIDSEELARLAAQTTRELFRIV